MQTRTEFAGGIAQLNLSHAERAVALLWFYRQTKRYEERSASDLANDLRDEGFPRPNSSRLAADLRRHRCTVRGKRPNSFQLDLRSVLSLDEQYLPVLGIKRVEVSGSVVPPELVAGTRSYLEKLVYQINGTYDYTFFDSCAVLCRRLMESLLIEIYVSSGREKEIRDGGAFFSLDRLLTYVRNDKSISLGRGTPRAMEDVKHIGDTAAHDRTYITTKIDIDDVKAKVRKLISELLVLAGVRK